MSDLPTRVVVGANGAYWRDYGSHYSMCPVSEDNDPVEPAAVYVRAADTAPAETALAAIIASWEATIKVIDLPAPFYRSSVLDAMAVWPKGANGPIAISAYEALVERLREHRAVVSANRLPLSDGLTP